MKNILFFIAVFATLQSCDDGDVIVTTFDFENASLNLCSNGNQYVFYKINNDVSESISLKITTDDPLFFETETKSYELNGSSNIVNYRRFDSDVTGDYFCSSVPPTSPTVAIDYTGASGTARLNTTTVLDDNDGLEDETGDTDGDGIPDSYDFDDDGDNVPTTVELGPNFPDEAPRDSDGDGTPDYLDTDDDNDGIFTIYEDKNLNLNPLDDITDPKVGPDYLNPAVADSYNVTAFRQHAYTFVSDVAVRLSNLVLVNGEEQIIKEALFLGTIENVRNGEFTPTPDFVAPQLNKPTE
ncbi:hypothetical protein [Marixanthomonas spongiae]|nr:hypothetical protein [Marixanthomonas spongiae]